MTPKAATEKKFIVKKDTKFSQRANTEADHTMREMDRVIRWRKIHDLLRKHNRRARKEQDITMEDAKFFRDNGLVKKEKSKAMGLRWGVALPPMTYQAIVKADIIIDGKSDLQSTNKEDFKDISGSNQLVKDLEKAFPEYKVS